VRSSDGWIGLKEFQDIPALAAGGSVHVNMTVTITRGGPFELAITADSNLWVPESNEGDNVASKKITVAYGECGKE
jgi:subtilase family serine protease